MTRAKFSECALIEIIHLHDCLRGALDQIQTDVETLVQSSSCIHDETATDENSGVAKKNSLDTNEESKESESFDIHVASDLSRSIASRFHLIWSVFQAHSGAEDEFIWPALKMKVGLKKKDPNATESSKGSSQKCGCESFLEAEEYEEDHALEESMFKQINKTLRRLNGSFRYYHSNVTEQSQALSIIKKVIYLLKEQTDSLTNHLEQHLRKEETQCLPMVQKHLSKDEISSLVGQIMGKRSADVMTKILNLALYSLPPDERADMVSNMKTAMVGTFFEKWLTMGGWTHAVDEKTTKNNEPIQTCSSASMSTSEVDTEIPHQPSKKRKLEQNQSKSTQLLRPPRWYRVDDSKKTSLVYSKKNGHTGLPDLDIPLFSMAEMTPTYHLNEHEGNMVFGCEHYARGCKLRHPMTGELYTCRLCCEEKRQARKYDDDDLPILDRHAVTEVLCMHCGTLQPAESRCVNEGCSASFAKYFCSICKLYDDDPHKSIYHCPYCNVCRKGKGLGIDYRHCMRCNACIGIDKYDNHVCIPQTLQGNCPICHEAMFDSTEPLRGMECGHVMHLSCFNRYVASKSSSRRISCPLCKKKFEHMRG